MPTMGDSRIIERVSNYPSSRSRAFEIHPRASVTYQRILFGNMSDGAMKLKSNLVIIPAVNMAGQNLSNS